MLIVIAEKEELDLVKKLGYENEPVLITGVGGVNVLRALKDLPRDAEILNIGYAGSNSLPVGTKVVVGCCNTYSDVATFPEMPLILKTPDFAIVNNLKKYTCYTSTDFVTHTNIKEPCVFDMELAFICALFKNVSAIKVVSDNLSYKDFKGE